MLSATVTRALAGSAVVILMAGCGSGSTPTVGSGQTLYPNSVQRGVPMRALPGPIVAGPLMVPAIAPNNGPGYIEPGVTKIVYVADPNDSKVDLYNAVTGKSIGTITQGVSSPCGLAIDAHGTLYVSNIANNTITEYLHGRVKPSFTIKTGLSSNYGVAVDSK